MNIGAPELIGLVVIVMIIGSLFFAPRIIYMISRAAGKGFKDGMNDKNP